MDLLRFALGIYLLLINIFSSICFFIDKKRAIKKSHRISESFLFMISILGGSLGSLLGMKVFHHKTRKNRFIFGIPIILVFNIIVFFYIEQVFIK